VAALRELAGRVGPVTLARDRVLPVLPALTGVVGEGLRRGSTTTVTGAGRPLGATTLALALGAAASAAGSWVGVVGVPQLHPPAAAALGISLERLALVPVVDHWPTVVGALVDALDVVVTAVPEGMRAADARRLANRAKERGCVLVPVCGPGRGWVEGADLRLSVGTAAWWGLEQGHGVLAGRVVEVGATGRGAAGRERTTHLWLPGPDGRVAVVDGADSARGSAREGARSHGAVGSRLLRDDGGRAALAEEAQVGAR
jgi:hypothetical protein